VSGRCFAFGEVELAKQASPVEQASPDLLRAMVQDFLYSVS